MKATTDPATSTVSAACPTNTAVALGGPRVTGATVAAPVSSTRSTVSSRSPSPVRSAERSVGSSPRTRISPLTRGGAELLNTTKRPSAEMTPPEGQLPSVPSDATITRSVTPVRRSWTKTSGQHGAPKTPGQTFVLPLTRLEAKLSKATKRPSAEAHGVPETDFTGVPSEATLTRSVLGVQPGTGVPFVK